MTLLEAHLVCLGLVAADLVARAWRIQWILRGLGHRVSFRDAVVVNGFGDAACALTPLRIGGEPARLTGMLRSGVPAAAALVGISLEVLLAWPIILVAAAWLVLQFAPAWWDSAGAGLIQNAQEAWPWVILVCLASVMAWRRATRVSSPFARQLQRPVNRIRVYWRRMPRWSLLAALPLTLVNLISRVAILPVLALTLESPPAIGLLILGSFVLLYGQLFLPTPSGIGAVELGFLGGVAGDLGRAEGWLLLIWRWYTSGVGMLLGLILAAAIYGRPALRKLIPARIPEATPEAGT